MRIQFKGTMLPSVGPVSSVFFFRDKHDAPHFRLNSLLDTFLPLIDVAGLGYMYGLYPGIMFSCLIAFIFPIIVTWASALNDSSDFWDSKTQVGSIFDCRSLVHGPFDGFGIGSSVSSGMQQDAIGNWHYDLMAELPSEFGLSICDQDVNSNPALTRTFSAVDNDTYKGLIPLTLSPSKIVHITKFPAPPNLAYRISTDSVKRQLFLTPIGSRRNQVVVYLLLGLIPILTGFASVWIYWYAFCVVKVHKFGKAPNLSSLPISSQSELQINYRPLDSWIEVIEHEALTRPGSSKKLSAEQSGITTGKHRQTVLIATLEYEINDWDIKIGIGGLGSIAHPMSKYLDNLDIVWVVPCIHGIEYPCDQRAEPMIVTISGVDYIVQVQYHFVQNKTYVLLDAPIFRAQTFDEPNPLVTGDIRSAIYYSAWYVFSIIERISALVLWLLSLPLNYLCCVLLWKLCLFLCGKMLPTPILLILIDIFLAQCPN